MDHIEGNEPKRVGLESYIYIGDTQDQNSTRREKLLQSWLRYSLQKTTLFIQLGASSTHRDSVNPPDFFTLDFDASKCLCTRNSRHRWKQRADCI